MGVRLTKVGGLVLAIGETSPNASFSTGGVQANETIPTGFRPAFSGTVVFASNNGGTVCSWMVNSAGKITLRGKADKGYYQTGVGAWPVA